MAARDGLTFTVNRWLNIRLHKSGDGGAALLRSEARTRPPTAETLVKRYRETVFAYAAHRMGNRTEAEDIAAEVFAAAFQALGRCPALSVETPPASVNPTDPARAWLLGIARRKIADYCRRHARRRETSLDVLPQNAAFGTDAETQPEGTILRQEAGRKIQRVMKDLKPDYKEVLLLKYVEEFGVAEIALLMGRSEDAISSLLQRARAAALAQGRDYFLGEEGKRTK